MQQRNESSGWCLFVACEIDDFCDFKIETHGEDCVCIVSSLVLWVGLFLIIA